MTISKFEKIGKYWPYCKTNHVITFTVQTLENPRIETLENSRIETLEKDVKYVQS